MSGKILVVDEIATNRIVLKVKLSTAFYKVIQAATAREALALSQSERPDLILTSGELPDMSCEAFIQVLHGMDETSRIPVIVILPENTTQARLAALEAGASDVMAKPLQEPLLLARLRSTLRQRHLQSELKINAETADALGFAEDTAPFQPASSIAILGKTRAQALRLSGQLRGICQHNLTALDYDTAGEMSAEQALPDAVLVVLSKTDSETGLRLISELRAAPSTRHARFIALVDQSPDGTTATALDMGASDAAAIEADPREILLRINAQLADKIRCDQMRFRLEHGLQAAVIDPLTGLYNRRYALSYLKRMVSGASQDTKNFAVMVADLDHFKKINDTYGHAAGDAVLARVANLLSAQLGSEDLVARIGGEEFLIALPNTSYSEARQAADRLCRLVRGTPIALPGHAKPAHVTISIGVTLGPATSGVGNGVVDSLINLADRALYESKTCGRDTVTFSTRTAA